jgi:hypothetical protein
LSKPPQPRSGHIWRKVISVANTAMTLMLLLAFAACSASGAGQRSPGVSATSTHFPAGWRLYRDPHGYFALGLPAGWQVIGGTTESHRQQSGPSGSAATVEVLTSFFPPDEDPRAIVAQLQVAVSYTLYTDTSGQFKQGMLCQIYT